MRSKVRSLRGLRSLAERLRKKGRKIVFTNGCFDLLHAGHVDYLAKAKRLGDFLIVGLNSDRSMRRLKGSQRPVTPQEDRARILSALRAVDGVVIFGEETPIRLIRALRPHVLVKGSDWPRARIVGGDFVRSYGGRVRRIPLLRGRSTTGLLKKIKSL